MDSFVDERDDGEIRGKTVRTRTGGKVSGKEYFCKNTHSDLRTKQTRTSLMRS